MHIDFSENYNTKYESEIQNVHSNASRRQISLHTGVAYIGGDKVAFYTVADCLKHGPAAIRAHLKPVLDYLKTLRPISAIHFISDGPTTSICGVAKCMSMGSDHLRGTFWKPRMVKELHTVWGCREKSSRHICVKRGHNIWEGVQVCSSVKLSYVEEKSILELEMQLPTSLKPVSDIMRIHQVNFCEFHVVYKLCY